MVRKDLKGSTENPKQENKASCWPRLLCMIEDHSAIVSLPNVPKFHRLNVSNKTRWPPALFYSTRIFYIQTSFQQSSQPNTSYIINPSLKMANHLNTLLTPSLLDKLVNAKLPFSMTEPLNFDHVGQQQFRAPPPLPSEISSLVWPVLKTLSKLGLSSIPNLLQFLPPVTASNFPIQALGLQLLLDQMSRALFQGIDRRWGPAYFDIISLQYAQTLDALPEHEKPWSWSRWKTFATLDYWVLARTWYICPFVHSDERSSQERALLFTEETRRAVEEETGTIDPYRAERDAILSDMHGVHRMIKEGPPGGGSTVYTYAYWMCKLMDIHKPVVDTFGRYPYRNAYFGRENTVEEEAWAEERGGISMPSEELKSWLKQDIDAGVWTPLGAGRSA